MRVHHLLNHDGHLVLDVPITVLGAVGDGARGKQAGPAIPHALRYCVGADRP